MEAFRNRFFDAERAILDMKKVLQVFYSLAMGGAETFVINIDKAMNHSNLVFDYLVFSKAKNGYEEYVRSRNEKVIQLRTLTQLHTPQRFIRSIKKAIEENGPYEAVHIHTDVMGFLPAIAAHKAGIERVICHSHTAKYASSHVGFIDRALLHLHRHYLKKYDVKLLACSDEAGKSMYGNLPYEIVSNCINTKAFEGISERDVQCLRAELGIKEPYIVLHVGRFDDAKNQAFLVNVAEELSKKRQDCCFVFVGDGVNFDAVKQRAQRLENVVPIYFAGIRQDIPTFMRMASVFALPSKFEGFPLVLIEAQCAGLPCVVSDAVTSSANLGVNMFCLLPLDLTSWSDAITLALESDNIPVSDASRRIQEAGYGVYGAIQTLERLYSGHLAK